jgi:hypothetical protein
VYVKVVYVPSFPTYQFCFAGSLIATRRCIVHSMRTVPRKSLWLSGVTPPHGRKLGACPSSVAQTAMTSRSSPYGCSYRDKRTYQTSTSRCRTCDTARPSLSDSYLQLRRAAWCQKHGRRKHKRRQLLGNDCPMRTLFDCSTMYRHKLLPFELPISILNMDLVISVPYV